ncbi:hypothetical protein YC2023_113870 [Brassica napus]
MPCNNKVMGLLITIKAMYHVPFETNTIRGIGSNECFYYHTKVEDSRSSIFRSFKCVVFCISVSRDLACSELNSCVTDLACSGLNSCVTDLACSGLNSCVTDLGKYRGELEML